MLEVSTPLNRSLSAIKTQIKNSFFRSVVEGLINDIEGGMSLSVAMGKYDREFSPAIISMLQAGEMTGALGEMLSQAELFERKKEEFRSIVKRAMTYPLFLVLLCLGVIVFILTFVFPKFADLFADIWEVLPLSTKILMAVSHYVLEYWYAVIIVLTALPVTVWNILQHEKVKPYIDRITIEAPVIGKLLIMVYTSQLLRSLSFLLDARVPLLEALNITRGTVRNILYKTFIDNIIDAAREGKGVAYAFLHTKFIPETVKQVIKTGEEAGRLNFVMMKLSHHYDSEVEEQFKLFSIIIEPLALLVMGSVVGFIVMSVVLPIFKLSRTVR
jgi:type II secretory pathway component PulF